MGPQAIQHYQHQQYQWQCHNHDAACLSGQYRLLRVTRCTPVSSLWPASLVAGKMLLLLLLSADDMLFSCQVMGMVMIRLYAQLA